MRRLFRLPAAPGGLACLALALGCAPPPPAPSAAPAPAAPAPAAAPAAPAPPAAPDAGCVWAGVDGAWAALADRPRLTVSGTLSAPAAGTVLVDLLSDEHEILLGLRCPDAGAVSLSVPQGLGRVTLVAVQDLDHNGPTANDAVAMRAGLVIDQADITDLALTLAPGAPLAGITLPAPADRPAGPPPGQAPTPGGPPPPPPTPDDDGGPAPGAPPAGSNPYQHAAP